MSIPEPPDGSWVACINSAAGYLFRRCDEEAQEWEHGEGGEPLTPEHTWMEEPSGRGPYTWKQVQSCGQLHSIDAKLGTSVTPDQMQDGKRYRVSLEGTFSHYGDDYFGAFDIQNGHLEDYHLGSATRIEEIGDANEVPSVDTCR